MKALIYIGPEQLKVGDVSEPDPAEGEVIVQVECAGICGSDMHAYLGHDERRPAPLILGHEVSGMVRGGALDGRRVTVNPLVSCGTCSACQSGRDNLCPDRQIISMPPREGGFTEAIAIPSRNVVEVPDHITLDQAALTEPIACGWHAARIAKPQVAAADADQRALVIGGGAIGLGAALSLRDRGDIGIVMVEPNETRRSFLLEHCGEAVIVPEAVEANYFDIVIDAVGIAPTRAQASAAVRPGGTIVHIGLGSAEGGLDVRRMTLQEITFVGTYTYTATDFRDTAEAMRDGRLGPLDWTESRPLSEGQDAFEDIRAGRIAPPKVILKPKN